MTKSQQPLSLNPPICNYTHQCRHEYGNYSLHGIKPANIHTHSYIAEITAHRRKIGAPNRKFEEVHERQTDFKIHYRYFLLPIIGITLCKDNASKRNENLFSNCRAQIILCKDNASKRNENLFSNCRAQLILCKDNAKKSIIKKNNIIYISTDLSLTHFP